MAYALITRDLTTILKEKPQVEPIPKEQLASTKPYWVPINYITNDTSVTEFTVREATVETIFDDRVERVTAIRDKTAPELDADDQARIDYLDTLGSIDRAQLRMLLNHENRIRTLESNPTPATVDDVKATLKTLMR